MSIGDKNNNYVSTLSLPVSGKVVVVDAGHGKPDEGTEAETTNFKTFYNKNSEKRKNLTTLIQKNLNESIQ